MMKTRIGMVMMLALVLAVPRAWAQSSSADRPESLQRQELQQRRITDRTGESARLLAELVDEFERNGLEGKDVEVLGGIQAVLGNVSSGLMPEIVAQLQQLRAAEETDGARATALTAYSGQKTVIYQLRQVLLEYQRQLALHALAERVQELGDRQSANLHEGVALVVAQRKPSAARRQGSFEISLHLQQTEQTALHREVGLVITALESLQAGSAGSLDQRPAEALAFARERQLTEATARAMDDLKEGRLMSGVGFERSARDTLWRLVAVLQPERDPIERLLDALARLDGIIADQEGVVESTRVLEVPVEDPTEARVMQDAKVRKILDQIAVIEQRMEKTEVDRTRARYREAIVREQARLAKEIGKARERLGADADGTLQERRAERAQRDQAQLLDRTDFLRQELEGLAEAAVGHLRESVAPMQEARAQLGGDTTQAETVAAAIAGEEAALGKLNEARDALLEEIRKAEFVEDLPLDKLEQLRELLEKVGELKEEQQEIKEGSAEAAAQALEDTQAPRQARLQERTEEVRQEAASPAPEAAESLAEAARQMERSEDSLARGENAPMAQQAALDALTRAEDQLREQIAGLEQAQEDLATLEELREKLDAVIKEQQDVQGDTIGEIAKPAEASSQQLAERQESLGEQTNDLQQDAAGPAPEAARDLGNAAEHMEAAQGSLENTEPAAAQPQQGEALQDLNAAREKVDERIAELQEQLGQDPAADMASMAEAAAAIEAAQHQVAEALSRLDPVAAAMQQLQEAQQGVAASLAEAAQQPGAPAAAQEAQAPAAQAAAELGQGDLPAAIGEMQAAQDAMAGEPALGQQAQAQAEVQAQAEALAAATQAAASPLQGANAEVSPFASGEQGALPAAAESALQAAQQALSQGAAEASAATPAASQASAEAAQASLAEAAAALALAQAGLGAPPVPGQGMAQAPAPGSGPPSAAPAPGQAPGQGPPPPRGTGEQGNWSGAAGAEGSARRREGTSEFIKLPKRDRGTLRQSQADSYSPEFGRMIEQYLKNLSDDTSDDE